MDAETCSICSAKVRSAGTGLKSYLSSGKSSAMAISLRPISFHCETTACDALGAALGLSLFALVKTREAHPASTTIATHEIAFFIFFLSVPYLRGPPRTADSTWNSACSDAPTSGRAFRSIARHNWPERGFHIPHESSETSHKL